MKYNETVLLTQIEPLFSRYKEIEAAQRIKKVLQTYYDVFSALSIGYEIHS